jgi:hypothetical protein
VIEKLFSLGFPPGLFHNGTKTQAAGRWYDGNLVRFYQGTVQPVGGWSQRTLTGATITGTVNDVKTVLRNDSSAYLIIATTTGLWCVDSSNVVTDITPPILVGQTTLDWYLENFGQVIIATVTPYVNANNNNLYKWEGDPAAYATLVVDAHDDLDVNSANYFEAPSKVKAVVATPERFLFCLQGADPAVGLSISTSYAVDYRAARSGYVQLLDAPPKLID